MNKIVREVVTLELDSARRADIEYDAAERMYNVYIYDTSKCVKSMAFGWPQDQPHAKDGHTEYTMDDMVELVSTTDLDSEFSLYYECDEAVSSYLNSRFC